jgi:succinate dehydrogenase / fumarate reductase cytochrome b subunit
MAMVLNRRVGFFQGLKYQGGATMIAWMLHRVSGIGILTFVSLHILASFFMQQLDNNWAASLNAIYESWVFQVVMLFFVLFHVLNGVRILVLDFWPPFQAYQRQALWVQWLIFAPVYGLTVFGLVQRAVSGS